MFSSAYLWYLNVSLTLLHSSLVDVWYFTWLHLMQLLPASQSKSLGRIQSWMLQPYPQAATSWDYFPVLQPFFVWFFSSFFISTVCLTHSFCKISQSNSQSATCTGAVFLILSYLVIVNVQCVGSGLLYSLKLRRTCRNYTAKLCLMMTTAL